MAALQQLYFTSCEHGVSQFSGYQFNALSPGVSPEIQREVLTLVGYRPPRSQTFPTGPDDLARCPVNLCFRPAGGPGTPAILTTIEYVGRDVSGRFGNFFAHAFAADTPADLAEALGPLLPIETWRSPVWVRDQSPETELPAHTEQLPRGGITPAAVRTFLADHPLVDRLPVFVTAVAAAQAGWGPPVLLIESDSDRAALWIGAVSYLLPPQAAAVLSFATYTADPGATRLSVVGTVPETAAELPMDLVDAFELFDMPAGRTPDRPALPMVTLAARVGVDSARWLWQTAETLAEPEAPMDAWYGPIAAAAVLGGTSLTTPETQAVVEWAARSVERLDPAVANNLAVRLYQRPECREEHLPVLFNLAWHGHNQALCDEIRIRQIDGELARVRDGVHGASVAARIESPRVRQRVATHVQELLATPPASAGEGSGAAASALRLLEWTGRTGLAGELDETALFDLSKLVLAPEVMAGNRVATDSDPLSAAMREWPALRQGFVMFLQSLDEAGSQSLDVALDGPLGRFLRGIAFESGLPGYPALQEAMWISRARMEPPQRVPVLLQVLQNRGLRLPDVELLGRIWPRGWSPDVMTHVAGVLPMEELDDEAVARWFLDTLRTASRPEDIDWYVAVSHRLLAAPVARRLATQVAPLAKAVELDRRCREAREFADLEWIARQDSTTTPMIGVMVSTLLPEVLIGVDVDADQVCSALAIMYPHAVRAFLARVWTPPLDQSEAGLKRIAGIFIISETAFSYDSVLHAELLECLRYAVSALGKDEWEYVRRLIMTSRHNVEDEFLDFEDTLQAQRSRFGFRKKK